MDEADGCWLNRVGLALVLALGFRLGLPWMVTKMEGEMEVATVQVRAVRAWLPG